jgi:hypothetical protein
MLHIGSGMSVDINGRGSLSDAHMKTSKSCSIEPEALFGMLPYRWMKLSRSYAAAVRVSNCPVSWAGPHLLEAPGAQ